MPRPRAAARKRLAYDVLAIGSSWGGVDLLMRLVRELPQDWTLPVVIVQHQHPNSGPALERILGKLTRLAVRDVEDKDKLEPGHVYIAPANYHLLIEDDGCFSLTIEAPVKYCRPAVDVTFASVARVYQQRCIGLVLTGANDDGADGLARIGQQGGLTIVQDPNEAAVRAMPQAAIARRAPDHVLGLAGIHALLLELDKH